MPGRGVRRAGEGATATSQRCKRPETLAKQTNIPQQSAIRAGQDF